MIRILTYLFFALSCIIFCSSCQAQISKTKFKKNVSKSALYIEPDTLANKAHKSLQIKEGSKFYVSEDIDLGGKPWDIPVGVTLIPKGGIIKNGTLYGSNTKIEGNTHLFNNVTIHGTWNVKNISTSLFKNLSKDNALRNVLALANDNVNNVITIEKGDYYFNLTHEAEYGISIPANSKVVINGNLKLRPDSIQRYYIVYVPSKNVSICGSGAVIGDKESHINRGGEWGMGVRFQRAQDCTLKNLTVKDCWGDCVCVSRNSKNIEINGCTLINGRRQGVSVTSADKVVIKDCLIKNVHGTNPQYAIDIEPDAKDTVTNVIINNVKSDNCVGGFSLYSGKDNKSYVRNIKISNCTVTGASKSPFAIRGAHDVHINYNQIYNCNSKYTFMTQRSENVKITNNTISTDKYMFHDTEGIINKGNKLIKGTLCPVITIHSTGNKL